MNPSDRPVSRTPVPLSSIRSSGSSDTFYREREFEERICRVASGILDRESCDASGGGCRHVGVHGAGIGRETTFEVRVDRQTYTVRDGSKMREGFLQCHAVVGPAHGPGKSGAGCRERRETELGEHVCAAEVPRVGHDEAARLVELTKYAAAFRGVDHAAGRRPHACTTRGMPATVFGLVANS